MNGEKASSEADAKRDLIGLLKTKGLSPEEHKKILAIATSMGHAAGSSEAEPVGTRMGKAVFILVTLVGIVLTALAWYLLGHIGKRMENLGPRAGGAPAVERDGSLKDERGPGR